MNKELLIDFCKAVRNSTLTRLRTVPEGYENWCISECALTFAEITQHLIDLDDWTINKLNDPGVQSILAEKGSTVNCTREQFNDLILELEERLKRKIEFIKSLDDEKIETKTYDDRFNGEVSIEWIFLRGNLDHEIHHRGQIAAYLRVLKDAGKT